MELTAEQWLVLEPLMGELPRRADGRGRPLRSSRKVLNNILWILRTGTPWADLPDRYQPYLFRQTCAAGVASDVPDPLSPATRAVARVRSYHHATYES